MKDLILGCILVFKNGFVILSFTWKEDGFIRNDF
jgi:hypothetical protein